MSRWPCPPPTVLAYSIEFPTEDRFRSFGSIATHVPIPGQAHTRIFNPCPASRVSGGTTDDSAERRRPAVVQLARTPGVQFAPAPEEPGAPGRGPGGPGLALHALRAVATDGHAPGPRPGLPDLDG